MEAKGLRMRGAGEVWGKGQGGVRRGKGGVRTGQGLGENWARRRQVLGEKRVRRQGKRVRRGQGGGGKEDARQGNEEGAMRKRGKEAGRGARRWV